MDWKELTNDLWKLLLDRQTETGKKVIAQNRDRIRQLQPSHVDGARLLDVLARWAELMPDLVTDVEEIRKRFEAASWDGAPLLDFVHFQLAGAFIAVAKHAPPDNVQIYAGTVLALAGWLSDKTHEGAAHYCLARSLRPNYSDALRHALKAGALLEPSQPNLAAIVHLMTSWLQFETGDVKNGKVYLEKSERVLTETSDWPNRGNLLSHHGKAASRLGDYTEAIRQFNLATAAYEQCDPPHKNAVRTLLNLAATRRLMAAEICQKEMLKAEEEGVLLAMADVRMKSPDYGMLLEKAEAHLRQAQDLHHGNRHCDPRNQGRILIQSGLLHLQKREFRAAEKCGMDALALARQSGARMNKILATRAELLLFWKECHKIRLGKAHVKSLEESGMNAMEHARQAVETANATHHMRLQARSHVALGLSHLMAPFFDRLAAEKELDEARSRLRDEDHDYVRREVEQLARQIEQAGKDRIVFQLTAAQVRQNLNENVSNLERVSVQQAKAAVSTVEQLKDLLGIGFERLKRIEGASIDPDNKSGAAGAG